MIYSFVSDHFILLFVMFVQGEVQECPPKEEIYPCKCEDFGEGLTLTCGGKEAYDVKKMFDRLSKNTHVSKQWNWFNFRNEAINELEEGAFGNFTFKTINIDWVKCEIAKCTFLQFVNGFITK